MGENSVYMLKDVMIESLQKAIVINIKSGKKKLVNLQLHNTPPF